MNWSKSEINWAPSAAMMTKPIHAAMHALLVVGKESVGLLFVLCFTRSLQWSQHKHYTLESTLGAQMEESAEAISECL